VDEVIRTDVLIAGTEGAGARAAISAHDAGASVTCVTKGFVGKSGATLTADADIDVDSRTCIKLFNLPGHPDDSVQTFFEDMVHEGDWINNQRLVEVHAEEAGPRIKDLVDWGIRIERLTHAPGHRYPRGIWIEGPEFARVLTQEIKKRPGIQLVETFMLTDILTSGGRCVGAIGLDYRRGKIIAFEASAVILCTGGAMRMYRYTTAPEELTGDGLAAAYRAGAELQDMEFPMFLPYILIKPDAVNSIDFPYLLAHFLDAKALNRAGQEYMIKWDRLRMTKSTRDVNAIAQMMEVLEGRGSPNDGTYLSLKHIPRNILERGSQWLPKMIAKWRYGAFKMKEFLPDLSQDAIECAPACHFWNGGIKITEDCETNLPGLYAAGEGTAGTHGSNRVSGNALTMTQVLGPRAGEATAKFVKEHGRAEVDAEQAAVFAEKIRAPLNRKSGASPIEIRKETRRLSHLYLNAVRDGDNLKSTLERVEELQEQEKTVRTKNPDLRQYNMEWIEALQTENLLTVMEMVGKASLMREESRGAMFRRDFNDTDGVNWLKNIIVYQEGEQMNFRTEPVVVTTMELPRKVYKYWDAE
jgi:succinate dehydrogenase/fumarate reductase flavoprotein subunit